MTVAVDLTVEDAILEKANASGENEPTAHSQPSEPGERSSRSSAPESLPEIVVNLVSSLRKHYQAVLETEDVEAVHKLRVATRRLQTAVDLLQTEETASTVKAVKSQLRLWRRRLSLVRNYDVFLAMLAKRQSVDRGGHHRHYELLRGALQHRRARQAARVLRYLGRTPCDRIATQLGLERAATQSGSSDRGAPPAEGEAQSQPAARQSDQTEPPDAYQMRSFDERQVALRAIVRIQLRLAEFHSLAADAHPGAKPEDLHQVRIAAKRLRYLLEVVSNLGYGDAGRALAWLRNLQDKIGDWHDLAALEEEIVDIVSRPEFMKKHLNETSRLLKLAALLQRRKEKLVVTLFPLRVPRTVAGAAKRLMKKARRISRQKGEGSKQKAVSKTH